VILIDLWFVSRVAAVLLEDRPAWPGSVNLVRLVGDRLGEHGRGADEPDRLNALARALHRHAALDPDFRERLRGCVVDAYADPVTAARLPNPAPRL
jgi:hypothetical protein